MDNSRLNYLFLRYLDKAYSEDEKVELMQLIAEPANEEVLKSLIFLSLLNSEPELLMNKESAEGVLQAIFHNTKEQKPGKLFSLNWNWLRITVAASIIIMLGVSVYFLLWRKTGTEVEKNIITVKSKYKNDVVPGGNRAVLTLADGSSVILDSAEKGTLTQQGSTKIIKLDDGQLAYNVSGNPGEVLYNTVTTPKGGQYEIILPDGSKVWLNAASSLHFPTSFAGKERDVELSGEGYFEIANNASMPFKVKVNDMYVSVLGTHFNINSYLDGGSIKTTLLEGSVKVTKGNNSSLIKPGQQARLDNGQLSFSILEADVNHEVAWKNGLFDFDNDNIQNIMRQLSRWYNVDIEYEGQISQDHYSGSIRREVNISQVLNMLELAGGIQFSIDGKNIKIIKK